MKTNIPPYKTCTVCKQTLPASEFNTMKTRYKGTVTLRLRSHCKKCRCQAHITTRPCKKCGTPFTADARFDYCSPTCGHEVELMSSNKWNKTHQVERRIYNRKRAKQKNIIEACHIISKARQDPQLRNDPDSITRDPRFLRKIGITCEKIT